MRTLLRGNEGKNGRLRNGVVLLRSKGEETKQLTLTGDIGYVVCWKVAKLDYEGGMERNGSPRLEGRRAPDRRFSKRWAG
jgi:hypothetical protein